MKQSSMNNNNRHNDSYHSGYTPPQHTPPQQGNGSGNHPVKIKPAKLLIAAAAAALVVVMVVFLVKSLQKNSETQELNSYVSAYNNVFCDNVYVDGISLGGMTQQQGYDAVSSQAQEKCNNWYLRLTYGGREIITLNAANIGLSVSVDDAMRAAWSQGHVGTNAQRKAAMDQLYQKPYYGYTALPSGDTSFIDSMLDDVKNHLYMPASDAVLLQFDPLASDPFIFQRETPGRSINTDNAKETIVSMITNMESGEYEFTANEILPDVTESMLREHVALRGRATTPISTKSTEDRTNNIRKAFSMITGTVLKPNSTFSFNKTVGRRTEKNGFFPAIEYAYGSERMGIGGGVCQASTTVYLAAVKAGLQIVKRSPHNSSVSYTDYGLDATVSWEGDRQIDLTFTNNTDSDIYIVAAVESDPANRKRLITKVSIYGESLGNVKYDVKSNLVETLDPPAEPKYVKDTSHEYVTYTDEEKTVTKAKVGYVYDSYRITYQGNTEVARDFMYRDTYPAKAAVVYVGTEKR